MFLLNACKLLALIIYNENTDSFYFYVEMFSISFDLNGELSSDWVLSSPGAASLSKAEPCEHSPDPPRAPVRPSPSCRQPAVGRSCPEAPEPRGGREGGGQAGGEGLVGRGPGKMKAG